MRSKWYKSNAPALQMALMKLIASPEELKRLSMSYSESKHEIETIPPITFTILENNKDDED